MKMTASDLKALGVIDRIITEPVGGAHRDSALASARLGQAITEEINALVSFSATELRSRRRAKFLAMGTA
jgi:acetyl-CoA carboxylase carboxyl transferase subunit alpha